MKRISTLILSGTFLTISALGGAFAQTTAPAPAQTTTPAPTQAPTVQSPAPADSTTANTKPMRGKMDANKDGAIESGEFTNVDRLKQADTNGDGTLSPDEIQAMAMKRVVQREARHMTRRLDANRDGTVTIAEVEQQRAKRFARLDRNNDGKLERREIRRAKKMHKDPGHRA